MLWFVKNLSSTAAFAIRRVTYFMKVTDCNFFGFNGVTSPLRMLACKGHFDSLSITRLRVVIYGSFSCAPKTFCIGLLRWSKLKVENAVNCGSIKKKLGEAMKSIYLVFGSERFCKLSMQNSQLLGN